MEKCLIWTRSREEWPQDSERLTAFPWPVIHLPCIMTEKVAYQLPDDSLYDTCLFTSARGVDYAFTDLRISALVRGCSEVYGIGAATCQNLASHGITAVATPDIHYGEEMMQHIMQTAPQELPLLMIGPTKPAYDPRPIASAHGFSLFYLAIYQTHAALTLTAEERRSHLQKLAGIVCFASPSAVSAFAAAFGDEIKNLQKNLAAVTIGKTTSSMAQHYFDKVSAAPIPTLKELIATAVRVAAV